jgi:DinB superfamily
MDVKPLVKGLLARNREVMESTMADVENAHAHWVPPGKALPLGALYVHVLTAEDFFIQGLLKGGAPLWDSSWKGNMGLSEPRPPRGQPWEDWARRVRIDMPKLREYAKAVFAATDAYVDSLSEGDLEKEIQFNERKIRLAGFFLGVMCTHCANHTGEISTLKGLQGLKGYPF